MCIRDRSCYFGFRSGNKSLHTDCRLILLQIDLAAKEACIPVSYTHLDVYKRQFPAYSPAAMSCTYMIWSITFPKKPDVPENSRQNISGRQRVMARALLPLNRI